MNAWLQSNMWQIVAGAEIVLAMTTIALLLILLGIVREIRLHGKFSS